MKISELIEALKKMQSEHGDIQVDYSCAEFGPTSVDYLSLRGEVDSEGKAMSVGEVRLLLC